jgi:hypothetical protein
MFGHVGQRTDRSTAAAARATPGVFVGTADNSLSYLMYNIDTQKVSKVSYATFDIHKFLLKLMLLAGQPVPPDFPTCSDSYCGGHLHHPDNLDDDALAETCCGGQIVLDLPC